MARLLCVDDDPVVVELVDAALRRRLRSWEVVGASSLAEAEERFAARAQDVVVLDLGLPDAEEDLLAGLRRVLRWQPRPAVVVLTGGQDRTVGMRAVDAGAQDYLEKHTTNHALLAQAIDYAHRRHQASQRVVTRADVAVERAAALEVYAESVSHDLRSPIGTVLMFAQAAEEALGSGTMSDAELVERFRLTMDSIGRLSERALRYCDELLQDALSESSKRERIDMLQLVSDATQLALLGVADGVSVEIGELPEGLYGQAASIRQVLVNLMTNASRHTPRPGGRIAVHARTLEGRYRLVVEDNGPGISPEQREEIFTSGVSNAGSTGLGLATVARVMQRHGGRVWIEDAEQLGGAAFILELPWRSTKRDT